MPERTGRQHDTKRTGVNKEMDTREVLEKVKQGEISIEEAEHYFRKAPFDEMGYAKLDMHRQIRSGFPEVIFCSGKADATSGADRKAAV